MTATVQPTNAFSPKRPARSSRFLGNVVDVEFTADSLRISTMRCKCMWEARKLSRDLDEC